LAFVLVIQEPGEIVKTEDNDLSGATAFDDVSDAVLRDVIKDFPEVVLSVC